MPVDLLEMQHADSHAADKNTGACRSVAAADSAGRRPASLVAADNSTRAELIEQWAATPTPELLTLLQALQDGNLLADDEGGKAYLQTPAGIDAEQCN